MPLSTGLTAHQLALHEQTLALLQEAVIPIRGRIHNASYDTILELCCDLEMDRSTRLVIAKGWNDPGFRILANYKIPSRISGHPLTFGMIANYCATQGLAITRHDEYDQNWSLETVIYSSGFNPASFCETITSICNCIDGLTQLCSTLSLCRSIPFSSA
jgi:hypothetical protein